MLKHMHLDRKIKKWALSGLSILLLGSLALSGIAATTSETRQQIASTQTEIRTKVAALEAMDLTDAQKAELESIKAEMPTKHKTKMMVALTDEQKAAIADMTPEEAKAYLEANMTDEQKAAMAEMEAKRASFVGDLTDEQKAQMEALSTELEALQTSWAGMTEAEREAKKAELKEKYGVDVQIQTDASGETRIMAMASSGDGNTMNIVVGGKQGGRGERVKYAVALTDEQKAAIADMTPEEAKAYLEANMTEEQKAAQAQKEVRKTTAATAAVEMTDEQKAQMEALRTEMETLRTSWDSMTEAEREAKQAELKEKYGIDIQIQADASGANGMFTISVSGVAGDGANVGFAVFGESADGVKMFHTSMARGIQLTEEQQKAIADMTPEEAKAYLEANMTDEQKAAQAEMEAKRAEWEASLTDEQKAEIEARLAEQLAKNQEILAKLNAIA